MVTGHADRFGCTCPGFKIHYKEKGLRTPKYISKPMQIKQKNVLAKVNLENVVH